VPTPFVHTSLEIYDGKIAKKVGFYPKGMGINFFGLAPGEVKEEASQKEKGVVVTKDAEMVRSLVKATKDVVWARYHPLKKNCFHWRNTVLARAGIEAPRDSFWG
jgi:hypothetical protein